MGQKDSVMSESRSVLIQGRANHEVQTVNRNTGIFEVTVCTSRFSAPLIHGLCPFFASNNLIHGLCAFFRLLLTPLSTAPSRPPSRFTVCTSRFARLRLMENQNVTVAVVLTNPPGPCLCLAASGRAVADIRVLTDKIA